MKQKHCFECGTALIEKKLENEGIVNRTGVLASDQIQSVSSYKNTF